MRIAHLVHGLFNRSNGVDIYIESFIETMKDHEHFIIVPEGKDNSDLINVIQINSLEDLPATIDFIEADLLIVHWTGAESFTDNDSILKIKDNYYAINGRKEFTTDFNPYSYLECLNLFSYYDKKFKTIIISHTTYKIPSWVNFCIVDAIVHVSNKAYEHNKDLNTKHYMLHPPIQKHLFKNSSGRNKGTKDKFRVGWLGTFNKYDSNVYNYLVEKYKNEKDIEFWFAGNCKIEIENIPSNFKFYDYLSTKSFFENIDLFLYPTKIDSFSLALLEAMSQSKICIASKEVRELGSLGDVIIYKENDFELISDTIDFCKNQPGKLKISGEKNRQAVINNFSPEIFVVNFEKILKFLFRK